MLKKIKKKMFPFIKYGFDKYHRKTRTYKYNGIAVIVAPEVFPPHLTISTKILLDYLKPLDLEKKAVLELGCGSGIIALFAASKGANVVASDINTVAIEALKKSSENNSIPITICHSDLFETIPQQNFEYIIINPPYYPRIPKNQKEQAWFCGENFEYFEKLFQQLPNRIAKNTLMILSDDCDLERIEKIAQKNDLVFEVIFEKKVATEKNYIFNIQKK